MMSKKILAAAVVAIGSLSLTGMAGATLINVQFVGGNWGSNNPTPQTGAAVTGSAGDVWNGLKGGTLANGPTNIQTYPASLNYADNTPSGASINFDSYPKGYFYSGSPGTVPANVSLSSSYSVDNFTATVIGIADGSYDFYIYSASPELGRAVQVTTGATNQTMSAGGVAQTAWVEGKNYLHFTPTVSGGTFSFSVAARALTAAGNYPEADINGFQLQTAVPEPTVIGLLGLATVGLLRRRSR